MEVDNWIVDRQEHYLHHINKLIIKQWVKKEDLFLGLATWVKNAVKCLKLQKSVFFIWQVLNTTLSGNIILNQLEKKVLF